MPDNRPTLGMHIRALRTRNGWTLKEMSKRTGIPLSTLSKVENDKLTLSYDKLLQLSERLNIRMSELFAEIEHAGERPVTARRSISGTADALRVNTGKYDYFYLCTELRQKKMIPVLTRIRAKTLEEFGDLVRHSGEEFIYVLEGSMKVITEFYDEVVVTAGKCIYLDSSMGHAYLAGDDCDEALTIAVCSADDENLLSSLISLHGAEAG